MSLRTPPSPPPSPPPGQRLLARRQHGVATRTQLLDAGSTPGQLRAEVNARRWQQLNERVFCMHNGPLTRRQALWAVLLSSPTTSALCGMTVLELHRVWGFATTQIHVLVTKGGRVLAVPNVDITIHETRTFPTEDVRLLDDFRATLPRRAVIDAASWAPDDFTAARVLVAGVQQIRVPPMLLREQVQKRTKLPRRRLLLLLCNDLEGGAQALSESIWSRWFHRRFRSTAFSRRIPKI